MVSNERSRKVRRSEMQWRRLISRYWESELSVAAFCRTEAVSEANFYRWRARLESDPSEGTKNMTASAFVDLGAVHMARDSGARLELKIEIGRIFALNLVRN